MPRTLLALALMCAALGTASIGHADPEPDPAALEVARTDFADGTSQFRAKKWAEALKSFERSYGVVASPNAELMIARCFRELGRMPESATAFTNAEQEAKRRVARGESKYAETANAAATEGTAVRAQLGEIRIHVTHANGASLLVDRRPVTMSKDGDADVFHDPGAAAIALVDPSGYEQKQSANLNAGSTVEITMFGLEAPPKPPPIEPPPERVQGEKEKTKEPTTSPSWLLPGVIASGGLTLAAGGVGIGFGLSSRSTFESLFSKCGPNRCGADQRAEADSGQRAQTIANVSYAVAAVALVATGVILYLGLTSSSGHASSL